MLNAVPTTLFPFPFLIFNFDKSKKEKVKVIICFELCRFFYNKGHSFQSGLWYCKQITIKSLLHFFVIHVCHIFSRCAASLCLFGTWLACATCSCVHFLRSCFPCFVQRFHASVDTCHVLHSK